ncbi:MAG TPA: sugar nucleotide-binding protein [Gaiellaceae bacterium]|jgi:dTDP-4-dehydrorhamnose reductase|nr:sugar nucleotide-binding protein [Gaiellaceae bacterium]
MKLLVTGGAGYLGSEICRRAVELGWEVLATRLDRMPPHGRPLRLDVRDEEATARAFLRHGPDVVVHTAYRPGGPDMESTIIRGSHSVALNAHRCDARLIHLSTDLVFDGEQGAPYGEEDEPRPVSPYGVAKARAEELVLQLHPGAVLVRTSLLYGKAEPGPQELMAFSDAAFYVDEIRCPTLVGELAAALLELGLLDVAGPLHVTGPDAVSRYELARRLRAAHGLDPDEVRGAPSPRTGRARNVALDCSRAADLLATRLRGVREVLE